MRLVDMLFAQQVIVDWLKIPREVSLSSDVEAEKLCKFWPDGLAAQHCVQLKVRRKASKFLLLLATLCTSHSEVVYQPDEATISSQVLEASLVKCCLETDLWLMRARIDVKARDDSD